jgi:hypothetical protein
MPNHVTNEIKIIGPENRVAEFLKQANVEGDEREFSFKGFVVPPDHPDYTSGGCRHRHPSPETAEILREKYGDDLKPGHPYYSLVADALKPDEHPNCWYVWNRKNWGTKWDAYDIKLGGQHTVLDRLARAGTDLVEEVVRFDTAWSPPFPVFERMIELYGPECRFVFRWMDEDSFGAGGGYLDSKDGELVDGINDPNDPETGILWRQMMRELKDHSTGTLQEMMDEIAGE